MSIYVILIQDLFNIVRKRDVAQLGSAPALGAGCSRSKTKPETKTHQLIGFTELI